LLYIFIASAQQIQFRRQGAGDSGAVVTPFMQDGTYPSRNFATLGPSGVRPPFTGTYVKTTSSRFMCQHWAEVRLYTSSYDFAKSCVFKKQSPLPLYCGHEGTPSSEVTGLICRVPSAPVRRHLSMFYPPTGVGFNTVTSQSCFPPRRRAAAKLSSIGGGRGAGHF